MTVRWPRYLPVVLVAALFGAGCGPRMHRPLPPEPGAHASGPFSSPLDTFSVLSPFGPRGGRFHTGIDIRNHRAAGDPVRASRDGRVTRAQVMSGYGKLVEIRHDDGFSTRYAHLRRFRVTVGQRVRRGDIIGEVGDTGRATTPHLHFEILTPGYRFIDPEPFIRRPGRP
jgi:murein DD-endopeptidase MepM/ murein hydrolase activator NlpD